MAEFQLIGTYRISPTEESIADAVEYHHYDWLLNEEGKLKDEIPWDNCKNLGLVELRVFGEYSPVDLKSISQDGQSPYMEFYLDPTGTRRIQENEAVSIDGRRVCFFLHFIDVSMPLKIGKHEIWMTEMTYLPERLAPYAHYVPVD